MTAIPGDACDITPDWLTDTLLASGAIQPGNRIERFDIEPVGEDLGYLSYLYRITPKYSEPEGAPRTMILKLPSTDPDNRLTGNSLRAYERESKFYGSCSDDSPCAPPRAYACVCDIEADSHLLLMELQPASRIMLCFGERMHLHSWDRKN